MPRLFREWNWSATELGSVESWPQSLRTAISLMLESRFPMVMTWGNRRTFLYNNAYVPILGQKHPHAFGQPFQDVWSDVWASVAPLVDSVDKGQSIFLEDLPFATVRNGYDEVFHATFSYTPIRDENEVVRGLFCAVVETTAQVQSRAHVLAAKEEAVREKAKFEAAFHAVAEGIFIFDSEGNPVFMNDAAAKVFGSEVAADVRRRVEYYFERLDLYDMDDNLIPISEWPVSKALRGESFREWYIKAHRKDTNDRWIWSSSGELARQAGSDVTLAVVVLRDVTEKVKAESELQDAKLEAERANSLKTAFLANMSHEIRTPLAAILGFSGLLKERHVDAAEKVRFLDSIIRNGNSLTRIIDDILDLAKVEAGKLEIENIPFSLYGLTTDVIEMFRDKAKEKNIYLLLNIDESVPAVISTDPTRVRQILVNLIGNALKFTDHGGIRVRVQAQQQNEKSVKMTIDVKDSGIGLTPEQIAKLFTPFTQADNSTTRKFGGTGLGLALSQRLSLALAGGIAITESTPGEGSTFTFTFVAHLTTESSGAARANPSADVRPSKPLDGLCVLAVDDSPDNLFLVQRLLTKNGAKVETAADGAEAVAKALAKSFDLILMDIQMPNLDGYQAMAALNQAGYEKPVVALTAHAMSDERTKTNAAGFAAHLTKPLNATELVTTIASLTQPKS